MMRSLIGFSSSFVLLVTAPLLAQPKPAASTAPPAPPTTATAAFPAPPPAAPPPAAAPAPVAPAPAVPPPAPPPAATTPGPAAPTPPAPAPAAPPPTAAPPPAAAPPAAPPPAAAPAPASPVAPAVPVAIPSPPAPPTDDRPLRARRPLSFGGELGWNGLAGLGLNFSYHPIPQLALDTGFGIGFTGWKLGLRVRANFLEGEWSPLLGAGILYGVGSGGKELEVKTEDDSVKVKYRGSPYAQLVGGVNYTAQGGFTFMAMTGYAILLRKNVEYVSGSEQLYQDTKSLVGSGLVLSISLGHSF